MRLPSVEAAWSEARAALVRFPLVILSGTLAAAFGMVLPESGSHDTAWRLLAAASLGLPLFFALDLWVERERAPSGRSWLLRVGTILALAAFAWVGLGWSDSMTRIRFFHVAFAAHLLAALLPAWGLGGLTGFWQYNRILLLRFLVAAFFSLVLFVGLSVALVACEKLLSLPLDDDLILRLWLVIAFIFHPWFFLGGVPKDLASLDQRRDYPTGLKVFSQFVLVPLVTVYLLILTAYLGRVVFTWTWPSGWIGWLVSSVAIVGILALLLVHPIRTRSENWWVDAYGRWFFVVLLPSVAMLLIALVQRVEQYGFTEKRYVMLALALWLAAVSLYYGVTGSRDIRVIPLTLLVLAVGTFAGPLSVYSVSERSQLDRLRSLLESNAMIEGDHAVPAPEEVSWEDARQISAVLRYLDDTRGIEAAAPVLGSELVQQVAADESRSDPAPNAVAERLGLPYINSWDNQESRYLNVAVRTPNISVPVAGFDYLIQGYLGGTLTEVLADGDTLQVVPSDPQGRLEIQLNGQSLVVIDLEPLISRVTEDPQIGAGYVQLDSEELRLEARNGEARARLMLDGFGLRQQDGVWHLEAGTGKLLIDLPSAGQ